jgi:hypothetical protein
MAVDGAQVGAARGGDGHDRDVVVNLLADPLTAGKSISLRPILIFRIHGALHSLRSTVATTEVL